MSGLFHGRLGNLSPSRPFAVLTIPKTRKTEEETMTSFKTFLYAATMGAALTAGADASAQERNSGTGIQNNTTSYERSNGGDANSTDMMRNRTVNRGDGSSTDFNRRRLPSERVDENGQTRYETGNESLARQRSDDPTDRNTFEDRDDDNSPASNRYDNDDRDDNNSSFNNRAEGRFRSPQYGTGINTRTRGSLGTRTEGNNATGNAGVNGSVGGNRVGGNGNVGGNGSTTTR